VGKIFDEEGNGLLEKSEFGRVLQEQRILTGRQKLTKGKDSQKKGFGSGPNQTCSRKNGAVFLQRPRRKAKKAGTRRDLKKKSESQKDRKPEGGRR